MCTSMGWQINWIWKRAAVPTTANDDDDHGGDYMATVQPFAPESKRRIEYIKMGKRDQTRKKKNRRFAFLFVPFLLIGALFVRRKEKENNRQTPIKNER